MRILQPLLKYLDGAAPGRRHVGYAQHAVAVCFVGCAFFQPVFAAIPPVQLASLLYCVSTRDCVGLSLAESAPNCVVITCNIVNEVGCPQRVTTNTNDDTVHTLGENVQGQAPFRSQLRAHSQRRNLISSDAITKPMPISTPQNRPHSHPHLSRVVPAAPKRGAQTAAISLCQLFRLLKRVVGPMFIDSPQPPYTLPTQTSPGATSK